MTKKTFKVGFDIHGIIDRQPELFQKITKLLKENGCEIHILTGSHITSEIESQLKSYKINYDVLFSISDYHRDAGTHMWYDENNNPWVDDLDWDRTKGEYCEKNNVHIHLDDTERYGKYFKTKFLYLNLEKDKNFYNYSEPKSLNSIKDIDFWFKYIFNTNKVLEL